MKRTLDILLSLFGLIATSPILVIVAIAVRVTSPGPVLFRQERVGRGGIPFAILKFRSMTPPSGEVLQVTAQGDSRITPIGRFIRKWKLDELPQLVNVLRGDMSVVGPRPEVKRYVAHYPEATRQLVLSIRPGITDFASLYFKDEEALLGKSSDPEATYINDVLPKKLALSERYVRERSILVDLRIIALTLASVTIWRHRRSDAEAGIALGEH